MDIGKYLSENYSMSGSWRKFYYHSKFIHRLRLVYLAILNRFAGRDAAVQSLERVQILHGDLLSLMFKPPVTLSLKTDHPVAYESDDHKFPLGSMQNNTRSPRFVRACERTFKRKLLVADLGCAGGGLVLDFLLAGHEAHGIEGSDYSQRTARAEWRTIPRHLHTADITKPFTFVDGSGAARRLDLITAWEVLEHLEKEQLRGLFQNLRSNLKPDGVFMASVACFESVDPLKGAVYHRTVEPKAWWMEFIATQGFASIELPFTELDFPRGPGVDWSSAKHPDFGFHLICRPV